MRHAIELSKSVHRLHVLWLGKQQGCKKSRRHPVGQREERARPGAGDVGGGKQRWLRRMTGPCWCIRISKVVRSALTDTVIIIRRSRLPFFLPPGAGPSLGLVGPHLRIWNSEFCACGAKELGIFAFWGCGGCTEFFWLPFARLRGIRNFQCGRILR